MIPFEKLVEGSILNRFLKELGRLKTNSEYLSGLAKQIRATHRHEEESHKTIGTNT